MEIRLIGRFAVIRHGKTVQLPGSRKTRALLAYLILSPGPHRRERLCEIFWQVPDDPRGSLRWSLSKLRNLVDDNVKRIVADRQFVRFDNTHARIDILELRDTVAGGLQSLDAATLADLANATAGGFLNELDLLGQSEFEHFLSSERESFRVIRRELLRELARRHKDAPREAVPWLQMLVEVEPYSLPAHHALIEALVKTGRKKDAQRQLESSIATLSEVEGVDLVLLRKAAGSKPSALGNDQNLKGESQTRDQQIHFCKAADGTQIAYAVVGDGPPLVKAANWLNHLHFDWESPVWRHIFHGLSAGRTLFRYDARGNGLSEWNIDDFSLDRQVNDLETVVAAIGLDRFPLLGISQGCAVSVEYAARYPEKITRLILIGGYVRGWNRRGRPELEKQTHAMMTLVGIGWGKDDPVFRQLFTSMFMPDAPPENHSWFNELQRISTTPANAVKLLKAVGEVDISDRLADVRAPTLVMHSQHDMRISFDAGLELAGGIPGARFVSLDSRNHILPESDPAWPTMLREINQFLAE
jgi:DNA-binding SARP family transcriptional activator/pimeloyl-ACP methyl ester carboxylesterase